MLCIADNCDTRTLAVLSEAVASTAGYDVRVIPSEAGDLGLSRNLAVQHAAGEYIGFVDADDLVSRNWFGEAYQCNRRAQRSIFHPECNLYFGYARAFFVHRNQSAYDLRALFFHNLWSALSFAHSDIYRNIEYQKNLIDQGFGYEDWHWNCETILGGHEHRMVPGTCHFVRLKEGSLSQNSAKNQCLIRPTGLWKQLALEQAARAQAGKWRRILGSWARLNQWHRQVEDTGLLSRKMFREPADFAFEKAPVWLHNLLKLAKMDEPAIDLSGRLANFSPRIQDPFVPYLSDAILDSASRGLDIVHFFDSGQTLKRVMPHVPERAFAIVEEQAAASSRNVFSIEGLEKRLGLKFEMYLAMLAVQSGCREIHIWNSCVGLRVVAKYKLALRSAVSRLYYHGDTAACPEELRTTFDACFAMS